jgi:hypothetical protein
MELRIIGQVELVVSESVWSDAYVDLLYVPKVPIFKGKIVLLRRKKCTCTLNFGHLKYLTVLIPWV